MVVVATSSWPGRRAARASPSSARNRPKASRSSSPSSPRLTPARGEAGSRGGCLLGLSGGELRQQTAGVRAIGDAVGVAAALVAAGAPQPWADVQGRRLPPGRGRRHGLLLARAERLVVEDEVPRPVHAERAAPQPVQGGLVGCLGEPQRERTEVGRAVGASGATLVERRHHRQQIGDRLARAAA